MRRTTALLAALALAAGCGGPALRLTDVSGTLTLDDKPVSDGAVTFTLSGEVPQVVRVSGGTFRGRAYIGKNHIQFAAYEPIPGAPPPGAPGSEFKSVARNVLPARYGAESTEFRDVGEGSNHFTFTLSSK